MSGFEVTYLGRGVSGSLVFKGSDKTKLAAANMPLMETFEDIAEFLEIDNSSLYWLTVDYRMTYVDHYIRYEVPKKSGGKRVISAPKPYMRSAQGKIHRDITSKLPQSPKATAFRKGISIKHNAQAHREAEVLIRIDLKDFFGSVTFSDVRNAFKDLGYNPGVSAVLALICTDRPKALDLTTNIKAFVANGARSLPQGAITSPALSNYVFARYDREISKRLIDSDWRYTRYADDLVFSRTSDSELGFIFKTVRETLKYTNFRINEKKTRISRAGGRVEVTGLAIDGDRIYIPRDRMRKYRAFLHRCETQGLEKVSTDIGKSAKDVAAGYWSFIYMVDPSTAHKLLIKHPWLKG